MRNSAVRGMGKKISTVGSVAVTILAFLLLQVDTGHGFTWNWNMKGKKTRHALNAGTAKAHAETFASAQDAQPVQEPLVVSNVPKLFWFDCGPGDDCSSASLYYVDPAAATPVKTLFDSDVLIAEDFDHVIPTGTLNIDYTVSALKPAYVLYFKEGKIWKVDTTTLVKTQVSNETGITSSALCELESFIDFENVSNSTLYYELAGTDNTCRTSDDKRKAVKLSTGSAAAPINLSTKTIDELVFGSKYIVKNWLTGTPPWKLQYCQTSLASCADIVDFTDPESGSAEAFTSERAILLVDGTLKSYAFVGGTLTHLYTPPSGEGISHTSLDKDGNVYFATVRSMPPYDNAIRKVSAAGGSVSTLKTFTTAAPLGFLRSDLSPTRVIYTYPNALFNAAIVSSVPKAGGTAVSLTTSAVMGGPVGEYLIFEDTAGKVNRIGLDGTGLISRLNARLNGVSAGGALDWVYSFDPTTSRVLISGIDNKLKSYVVTEDFTNTSAGTLLGTVPVNLSNLLGFDLNYDMIAAAERRNADFSFGRDILFLRATSASSLKRLTNSNGSEGMLIDVK